MSNKTGKFVSQQMQIIEGERQLASVDPLAGSFVNGKEVWAPDRAADNLLREGYDWYMDDNQPLADGVLTYGFWTSQEQLEDSYIYSDVNGYAIADAEPGLFFPITAEQVALGELAMETWDDVLAISIERVDPRQSDIAIGNSDWGPNTGAGAGAWYPGQFNGFDEVYEPFGWGQVSRLSGDIWINTRETSNFDYAGYYALSTIVHEAGHSLGLAHSGDYNASDDVDGIPGPDPITYEHDAYFYQDNKQYSIMSYFLAFELTGAQQINFGRLEFLYPQTPMVHDILAAQSVYGVDTTTRTGDTVYGFNSNADKWIYDFSINDAPFLTIWDAGGNDTLDFSGFTGTSVIDLNEGAFSSGSHVKPTLEQMQEAFGDPTFTQADYDAFLAAWPGAEENGELSDNIAIAYGVTIENAVGGVGNDMIISNAVANNLHGGGGFDTVSYRTADSGVIATLILNRGLHGEAKGDKYTSIEGLEGSEFNDVLTGKLFGDSNVSGLGGNDVIYGGKGNNVLDGGAGSDAVIGDDGNDTLNGGAGNDVLTGGRGSDTYVFQDAGADTILDYGRGEAIDLTGLEVLGVDVSRRGDKIFVDLVGDQDLTINVKGDRVRIEDIEFAIVDFAASVQTEYVIAA